MTQSNDTGEVAGGQQFKPHKVMEGGLIKLLETYVNQKLAAVRTTLPAKVISVDYERSLVNLEPLIKTMFDPVSQEELAIGEVLEVPIIFNGAQRGVARKTYPIAEGTIGLLHFSDRHTEKYLASDAVNVQDSGSYHTIGADYVLNVIGFEAELFTYANAMPFDKNDVVEKFKDIEVRYKKDGTIVSKNSNSQVTQSANGDVTVSSSGNITLDNGSGYIKVLADGSVNINGFIISPSGSAVSPSTITATQFIQG